MNKDMPFDIAVVGLGIDGVHQITREAEETIRRCRETLTTDLSPGVADYLREIAPTVTDLARVYAEGSHRVEIYRRMASEVIAAALESGGPVCFATYGHPQMYCYPTILIRRSAQLLDLRVRVLPGISFLDTLLIDVGLDPGFDGLQMYEATDLLVRRRPLQTDVSCVIVQAPIVLDAFNRPGFRDIETLAALQSYLLEFYPRDHQAVIVVSKTHPLLDSATQTVALGALAAALERGGNIGTVYIPPVAQRDIAEPALAERMRLPERDAVTGSDLPSRRAGRPAIGPRGD